MDYYYIMGNEVYKMDPMAQRFFVENNIEYIDHKYVGNERYLAFKTVNEAWQFLSDINLEEQSRLTKEFKRLKDNQFHGSFKTI